jgi:predicted Zn-dependent protease
MPNRCFHLAVLLSTTAVVAGCATNPVTGDRQLAFISEAPEIEMGRAAADVRSSIGLVNDAELQTSVRGVSEALARTSHRPTLPGSFGVVDDPTPNAFALPGGFIFLTRGMMNLMNSEAELASVLAHEIGHVTARHSVTATCRHQLAQFGLASTVFDARSGQGLVRGVVAHVSFRGRTYQLLGYTAESRFAAYGPLFEQFIASFRSVRDPAILNVQPQRVDVVRLDRAMTVAEFGRRYGSTIAAAELALINQAPSPTAVLPARSLAKRVMR